MNGTTANPVLVLTFEFKLKYDEKPLSVKYVVLCIRCIIPKIQYITRWIHIILILLLNDQKHLMMMIDNSVTLLFNVVNPETFIDDTKLLMKHYCLMR
jgi:hypothetical protein